MHSTRVKQFPSTQEPRFKEGWLRSSTKDRGAMINLQLVSSVLFDPCQSPKSFIMLVVGRGAGFRSALLLYVPSSLMICLQEVSFLSEAKEGYRWSCDFWDVLFISNLLIYAYELISIIALIFLNKPIRAVGKDPRKDKPSNQDWFLGIFNNYYEEVVVNFQTTSKR
jgi:hypothetical protein